MCHAKLSLMVNKSVPNEQSCENLIAEEIPLDQVAIAFTIIALITYFSLWMFGIVLWVIEPFSRAHLANMINIWRGFFSR